MSTRCQVKLVWGHLKKDFANTEEMLKCESVILYHHSDGYPSFMGLYLEKMIGRVATYLEAQGVPYWWDDERVSACMILMSVASYSEPVLPWEVAGFPPSEHRMRIGGSVPSFHPSAAWHGDIEYVWLVQLGPENGEFKVRCFEPNLETEIDWRAEVERKKAENDSG